VKVLLLVNSTASSVTARVRVVIQKALSADHEVTVAETTRRGHATRLSQGAAAAGTEVVVVLGGDGTLNEAANGIAGTPCALAALPGGSTNVFARSIGTPDDPIEATGALVQALDRGSPRSIGLGRAGSRYFLFHTGIGFDAAVVEQVEKRGDLKRYAGHPLFIWSGITTWLRHYDRSRPAMGVHYPDGTTVPDAHLVIVLNHDPYTYLGTRPLSLAPEATLDRPLAVVAVRTMAAASMVRLLAGLVRDPAAVRRHPKVHVRTDVEEVRIVGHRPVPYQVDGDHLGAMDELDLTWEADALRLVVPAPVGR
jgi:diacylglycerol kinase family enzyme